MENLLCRRAESGRELHNLVAFYSGVREHLSGQLPATGSQHSLAEPREEPVTWDVGRISFGKRQFLASVPSGRLRNR